MIHDPIPTRHQTGPAFFRGLLFALLPSLALWAVILNFVGVL